MTISISAEDYKATLMEAIISDEMAWFVSDKTETTSSEALRFMKNNIETIIAEIFKSNRPATIVIPELIRTQA